MHPCESRHIISHLSLALFPERPFELIVGFYMEPAKSLTNLAGFYLRVAKFYLIFYGKLVGIYIYLPYTNPIGIPIIHISLLTGWLKPQVIEAFCLWRRMWWLCQGISAYLAGLIEVHWG